MDKDGHRCLPFTNPGAGVGLKSYRTTEEMSNGTLAHAFCFTGKSPNYSQMPSLSGHC